MGDVAAAVAASCRPRQRRWPRALRRGHRSQRGAAAQRAQDERGAVPDHRPRQRARRFPAAPRAGVRVAALAPRPAAGEPATGCRRLIKHEKKHLAFNVQVLLLNGN